MNLVENKVQINEAVNSVISKLGFELDEVSHLMGVKNRKLKSIKGNFASLPISSICNLANNLNLDLENFLKNRFDLDSLEQHFKGNLDYLPEKYRIHAKSKMKTITNVLDLLKKSNTFFAESIQKKLQITKKHLLQADLPVCGNMLIDIFSEMSKFGYSKEMFEFVGKNASKEYKDILLSPVDDKITRQNLYEKIFNSIDNNLEKNLFYKVLKVTNSYTLISASTREDTKDNLGIRHFGNFEHYVNIQGWLKGINHYFYDCPARVKMLSSIHEGDTEYIYSIEHTRRYCH